MLCWDNMVGPVRELQRQRKYGRSSVVVRNLEICLYLFACFCRFCLAILLSEARFGQSTRQTMKFLVLCQLLVVKRLRFVEGDAVARNLQSDFPEPDLECEAACPGAAGFRQEMETLHSSERSAEVLQSETLRLRCKYKEAHTCGYWSPECPLRALRTDDEIRSELAMLECACACPSYYHKGLYELTFGLVPYAETKRCSFVATERCFQTQRVCHWVFEDESLELALRIFNVSAMCDPGIVSECEAKGHATSYEGQAAPVACDETNETVDNNAMGLCLSVNFYFLLMQIFK